VPVSMWAMTNYLFLQVKKNFSTHTSESNAIHSFPISLSLSFSLSPHTHSLLQTHTHNVPRSLSPLHTHTHTLSLSTHILSTFSFVKSLFFWTMNFVTFFPRSHMHDFAFLNVILKFQMCRGFIFHSFDHYFFSLLSSKILKDFVFFV